MKLRGMEHRFGNLGSAVLVLFASTFLLEGRVENRENLDAVQVLFSNSHSAGVLPALSQTHNAALCRLL